MRIANWSDDSNLDAVIKYSSCVGSSGNNRLVRNGNNYLRFDFIYIQKCHFELTFRNENCFWPFWKKNQDLFMLYWKVVVNSQEIFEGNKLKLELSRVEDTHNFQYVLRSFEIVSSLTRSSKNKLFILFKG